MKEKGRKLNMEPEIKIRKINAAEKELILKIADWYFDEWQTPLEKTIQRLTNQPSEDTLFQLILTVGDDLVATGGLCNQVTIFNVHERLAAYRPWLALLYTEKAFRKKGLGKMLLENIEQEAKKCNLTNIYLYTFTAESFYKRAGWKELDRVLYKGHETVIMGKDL